MGTGLQIYRVRADRIRALLCIRVNIGTTTHAQDSFVRYSRHSYGADFASAVCHPNICFTEQQHLAE